MRKTVRKQGRRSLQERGARFRDELEGTIWDGIPAKEWMKRFEERIKEERKRLKNGA